MGAPASAFVKTLVYMADGKPVLCCVPGDYDVNEIKLKHLLDVKTLELAPQAIVEDVTGAAVGFAGPVGAKVRVVADQALEGATGMICGGNKTDVHLKNVDLARDCTIETYADLVIVKDGDICPKCGQRMVIKRGIEVGHVFKLGTKYTDAFKAVYKNDALAEQVMIMGCYGIGISRTVQAVIEQSHDKDGIVWPASVAPFQVGVENLDPDNAEVTQVANDLEAQLEAAGVDVIVDDRAERPGVKFKDADLIGFPVRVVVGAKGLANGISPEAKPNLQSKPLGGCVEVKRRCDDKSQMKIVPVAEALEAIKAAL